MGVENDLVRGMDRLLENRFADHEHDLVTAVGCEKVGQAHEQGHWWHKCTSGKFS